MTESMTRGEAMGLLDGSGTPRTEWDRLVNRLPDIPPAVGVETSAVAEAREAAVEAYQAIDDLVSTPEAYELLTRPVEQVADERYRAALKSGEKAPAYPADELRRQRVELQHRFDALVPPYRTAVSRVKQAIRDTLPEAAEITAARYTEAESAYREAWLVYKRAKQAYADAVDARAEVLEAGGDGETTLVSMRTSLRNNPVSDVITGPAYDHDPVDVVRDVRLRFVSLELPDPGKVGTGRQRGASGESASFDDQSQWA